VRGDASGSSGTRIGIRPAEGILLLDRTGSGATAFSEAFPSVDTAPIAAGDGAYRLTVYTDRCSVEVFAQDGLVTLTDLIFPDESATGVALYARGGEAHVESVRVTPSTR
jgi:sucrose-6-phosphate hydrolase SacC (GH32 family)